MQGFKNILNISIINKQSPLTINFYAITQEKILLKFFIAIFFCLDSSNGGDTGIKSSFLGGTFQFLDSLFNIITSDESHDTKNSIQEIFNNDISRSEVEIEGSNIDGEDTTSKRFLKEFEVLINEIKLDSSRNNHHTKENIISSCKPIERAENAVPEKIENTNSKNSQTNKVISTMDSLLDGLNVREGESFFVIDFIHVMLKKLILYITIITVLIN